MATLVCDLDGCTFLWGTNTFVDGAYDELKKFSDAGGRLVFITQRDSNMEWAMPLAKTELYLRSLFPGCVVLFGYTSPRIIMNDAGAAAINHPSNAPWNYDLKSIVKQMGE